MDHNSKRGRSLSQGDKNHRSPTPSPHQFHAAVAGHGLDPSISTQTFRTGKFNNGLSHFSTPFLDSSQPQDILQTTVAEASLYSTNHFDQGQYQENQAFSFPNQTLDSSFADNQFMYQHQALPGDFSTDYSLDDSFDSTRQSNVNPADLSKMSSPHIATSPSLLPPEGYPSPGLPGSPGSTQCQFYTPQHSRHQSLDPSSAAYPLGEWQAMSFQQHRRAHSDHSDVSSNAPSPFLAQPEVLESIEKSHSPQLPTQVDNSNTFGIDGFSLAEQPRASPHHSPYVSPRLLPQQNLGLGVTQSFALQNHMGGPGPEIYTTSATDQYPSMAQIHARNGSAFSEMGQADQYAPPIINIEPAPVSRQASFEPEQTSFTDALSPPTRQRGRSNSDPHLRGPASRPMSRSPSPASRPRSPSLNAASQTHSVRSLSPGASASRETSPGPTSDRFEMKNRRSSTSSIPSRDYILDLADPSRPNATPSHSTTRVQKHPATFQCSLCPKRFTRAYNLRSHLRTHTDERPFVCTVCRKAFARQHDRKRHEGLHSGEKKFVCRGELKSPGQWGCGRKFARADALGRHFRSEAGRICIKPLLDEEAAERARHRMIEQHQAQFGTGALQPVQQPMMIGMDATGTGGFALPAALLAQYPALSNLDWSSIPQGEDPGELSDVGMDRSSFEASSGGEYYDEDDGSYAGAYANTGQAGWV